MYLLGTLTEFLFGSPPFASKTLEELEKKLLDTKPVEVSKLFTLFCKTMQYNFCGTVLSGGH